MLRPSDRPTTARPTDFPRCSPNGEAAGPAPRGRRGGGGAAAGAGGGPAPGRNPPARSPRLRPAAAVAEHPVDAAEQEQLALTVGTATHMLEQLGVVAVVEQIRQPLPRLLVIHGVSSPSSPASRFRPRRFQLLTEPSGAPRGLALALSLRSRKSGGRTRGRSRPGGRAGAGWSQKASSSCAATPVSGASPIGSSGRSAVRTFNAVLRASVISQAEAL